MSKAILVTGATGKQGGAVVDALLALQDPEIRILALTRDTSSASAQRLAALSPDIKLVRGNLDDAPGLFATVAATLLQKQRLFGVFSVQVSLGTGVDEASEVAQGRALVDAAAAAGVEHFVYSSVERGGDAASWDNPTPIPHFRSKYEIERHLRAATAPGTQGESMGWTILRPVAFMDNLVPGMPSKVFLAALRNYLGSDKALQWVATSDIGVFAAKAFQDPEGWKHRAVGLAGDELTSDQLSEAFQKATGQPAPETFWFLGSVLTTLMTEMRLMIGWFATDGYKVDIAQRRAEHPAMLTMEQWLAQKSGYVTR